MVWFDGLMVWFDGLMVLLGADFLNSQHRKPPQATLQCSKSWKLLTSSDTTDFFVLETSGSPRLKGEPTVPESGGWAENDPRVVEEGLDFSLERTARHCVWMMFCFLFKRESLVGDLSQMADLLCSFVLPRTWLLFAAWLLTVKHQHRGGGTWRLQVSLETSTTSSKNPLCSNRHRPRTGVRTKIPAQYLHLTGSNNVEEPKTFGSYKKSSSILSTSIDILLMAEILHQLRLVVYPIVYRVSYIPGGARFQPSTVGSIWDQSWSKSGSL